MLQDGESSLSVSCLAGRELPGFNRLTARLYFLIWSISPSFPFMMTQHNGSCNTPCFHESTVYTRTDLFYHAS